MASDLHLGCGQQKYLDIHVTLLSLPLLTNYLMPLKPLIKEALYSSKENVL